MKQGLPIVALVQNRNCRVLGTPRGCAWPGDVLWAGGAVSCRWAMQVVYRVRKGVAGCGSHCVLLGISGFLGTTWVFGQLMSGRLCSCVCDRSARRARRIMTRCTSEFQ